MAAGVAIDVNLQLVFIELADALMKGLAAKPSVGVGLDDDFVEHIGGLAAALHEKHAHGIDVEVHRPNERKIGIKRYRLKVEFGIESVVNAIGSGGGEYGFKFLTERLLIKIGRGRGEFGGGDVAALGGGELESGPFGIGLRTFVEIVKMVAALGCTEK